MGCKSWGCVGAADGTTDAGAGLGKQKDHDDFQYPDTLHVATIL